MSLSFGKITDEGVEKLRSRIDVERKGSTMHQNTVARRMSLLRRKLDTLRAG